MHTTQISDVADGRQLVEALGAEETAVIVRADGTPAAYIMSPEAYEAAQRKTELLLKVMEGLESAAVGRTYSQEEVEKMFEARRAQWRG
jgi:PHD/YefM family antitoxin component YafN of YafNO toxin-antitoxin module